MTDLARELGQLRTSEGRAPWVRLHYVYPYPHVDAVIPLMADGLLTPYLDIPFQHASPSVLKRMKRPANEAKVLDRLKSWRAIAPDIAVRSSRSEEHTSELQSLMRISYAVFCLTHKQSFNQLRRLLYT